jgi:hypothetical protein
MQGYQVRKWIALLGMAALQGCGDGPTAPTPDFVGNYTLVVEASPVCELPVERYTWDLIATSSGGSGPGARYLLVLPGGNTSVSVSLNYATVQSGRGRSSSSRVAFNAVVSINAPFGTTVHVQFGGQSRGTASVAADGRGEVLDGILSGRIEVIDGTQRPPATGNCTAADHKWVLTPR